MTGRYPLEDCFWTPVLYRQLTLFFAIFSRAIYWSMSGYFFLRYFFLRYFSLLLTDHPPSVGYDTGCLRTFFIFFVFYIQFSFIDIISHIFSIRNQLPAINPRPSASTAHTCTKWWCSTARTLSVVSWWRCVCLRNEQSVTQHIMHTPGYLAPVRSCNTYIL